jgi:G8 domain
VSRYRRLGAGAAAVVLALAIPTIARAQDLWSNPATWGGSPPGDGAHVVIPQGRRIVLDTNPPRLASLTVNGVLSFGPRDLALTTGWIMVHGMLEIGTEEVPYPYRATITLDGPLDDNVMGMGARAIGAMNGGRIEIHGTRRADVDWAVLARTARPGDTSLGLALVEPRKTVLGWRPGDLLVVAPSGADPFEAEPVTVTAVTGTEVSFTPPLRYTHMGELQTIAGRLVDERAEVGLLTRNVVIQGAADGHARRLGGHIMIMAGGIGRIEGAELRFMGQTGRLGRYPIHWHLAGAAPIDYARFTSVWNSFHRGLVLHGTTGVEVRGNVAANVWSHTFVVGEDGTETGNTVEDNLGVLTRRLPDAAFVLKRRGEPGSDGPGAQDEWRPATFWVNNANNRVRGNRAAGGVDAIGFFYDDDHGRAAAGDLTRTDFAANVAHSYLTTTGTDDPDPAAASGIGLLVRMAKRGESASFAELTAYRNTVAGAWLEGDDEALRDSVVAGNGSGVILGRGTVASSLVAGETSNPTPRPPGVPRGGVRVVAASVAPAPRIRDVTVVRQDPAAIDVDGGVLMPGSVVEGLVTSETPVPVFLRDRRPDHGWQGALLDVGGSMSGVPGASITGTPMADDSGLRTGWGSYVPGGAFVTPPSAKATDAPTRLTAFVAGTTVRLAWIAPASAAPPVEGYVIEAGAAAGRVDVTLPVGPAPAHEIAGAPAGTFVVRVRAQRAGVLSASSNEIVVRIGGPSCLLPDVPMPLSAAMAGGTVTLAWSSAPSATAYRLAVGSAPGAEAGLVLNLPPVPALSAPAPAGRYALRVAAVNACGISAYSNEVVLVVP